MPTKEYQEAVSELLDILENTDEELIKKIPPELIVFWKQNKSEEYVSELDHSLSLEEMKLKTKTRELIAMIYVNYLCDSEKKRDIQRLLKDAEEKEIEDEKNIDIFARNKEGIETLIEKENTIEKKEIVEQEEDLIKIKEDIYMIKKEEESFFAYIIDKIKRFFRKIIY